MFSDRVCWTLILACCLIPSIVSGQPVHGDETEIIQAPARSPTRTKAPHLSEIAKLIIRHTNAFRQEEGLRTVAVNPKLTQTAQDFANFMARTNKYGHTADGNGPAERAKKHGYDYCIISENIAYQYSSAELTTEALAQEFFAGWKQSPEHRKNMLHADVTETGVAVAQNEETRYFYAVQMFGRPSSQRIQFRIVNHSDAVIRYKLGTRSFSLPTRYIRTHQGCTTAELTFQWPDGSRKSSKQRSKIIQPHDGDRYIIVQQQSGEFSVRRE